MRVAVDRLWRFAKVGGFVAMMLEAGGVGAGVSSPPHFLQSRGSAGRWRLWACLLCGAEDADGGAGADRFVVRPAQVRVDQHEFA